MTCKLFFFKASDAPILAILCRYKSRTKWQLLVWNLETDTITEGQWLTGKHIDVRQCAISPNGVYFSYSYSSYFGEFERHSSISRLPMFTSILHKSDVVTDSIPRFVDVDGSTVVVVRAAKIPMWSRKFADTGVCMGALAGATPAGFFSSSAWDHERGLIDPETWVFDGRMTLVVADGNIFTGTVGSRELKHRLDVTHNEFRSVAPNYPFEEGAHDVPLECPVMTNAPKAGTAKTSKNARTAAGASKATKATKATRATKASNAAGAPNAPSAASTRTTRRSKKA